MIVCHAITFLAKLILISFGFIEPKKILVVGKVCWCQQEEETTSWETIDSWNGGMVFLWIEKILVKSNAESYWLNEITW